MAVPLHAGEIGPRRLREESFRPAELLIGHIHGEKIRFPAPADEPPRFRAPRDGSDDGGQLIPLRFLSRAEKAEVIRGMGEMRTTLVATFIQISVRALVIYLLVPRVGLQGAAWACAVGWGFMLVYTTARYRTVSRSHTL